MTIRFSSPVVSRAPRAIPNVVSIAGIDPSGGAGLFADLKAFSALGAYGCGIVAALTAQNTRSVTGVHLPPNDFIRLQLDTLFDDVPIASAKIGMLGNAGVVRAVADGSAVDWASAGDKLVEVTALNEEDQAVFTARITMNVKLA